MRCLLNVVTKAADRSAAVLVRALEPLKGIDPMKLRRTRNVVQSVGYDLFRGPGNLTKALSVTLAENLLDLTSGALRVEDRGCRQSPVALGSCLGIRVWVGRPWRRWVSGHASVLSPCRRR